MAGKQVSVKIKGFADRIDASRKSVRIIDYKTGSTDKKRTKVDSWAEFATDPAKDHAFQLLSYCWMYLPRVKNGAGVAAGIISLRKLKDGLIMVTVPSAESGDDQDILSASEMAEFETSLKQVLLSIFDTATGFTQTRDLQVCSYCSYKNLCGR